MKTNLFKSFKYVVRNSFTYKNKRGVKVFFIYKERINITLPLMIKKIKSREDKQYYIDEAEKIIAKKIKDGSLEKYSEKYIKEKKKNKLLRSLLLVLCACILAGAAVGIYYAINQPVTPEPVAYSISMVTEGVTISPDTLPTTEDYVGTINVTATGKMLDGISSIELEKSGTDITNYEYVPSANNKSAQLTIEKQYLTDNIKIKVNLIDEPTYHISMRTPGADIESKELPTDKDYNGTIHVTANKKNLNGLTLVTLKDSETDITEKCTYKKRNDKYADLVIPLDYLTNDIEVTVALVDEPKPPEIKYISMLTEGTDIESKELPTDKAYKGTITVTDMDKILDELTLVTLKDGEDTDITTHCTYEEQDDKTATLEIPLNYLTNDIEVTVTLADAPTPIDPHRQEELTFTCETAGSLGIYYHSSYNIEGEEPPIRDDGINVSYKIGEGGWQDVNIEQHFADAPGEYGKEYVLANLTAGQEIHIRGDNEYWSYKNEEYPVVCDECLTFFTNGGKFKVSNNVMSLLSRDDFVSLNEATDYGFRYLFSYGKDRNANISDASDLYLPTNLAPSCFESMFQGNKNLIKAPNLPATYLYDSCYWYMFEGCTSLTTAPDLPAETLAGYCYNNMFAYCTKLVNAPTISAKELAYNCCEEMFLGCTALKMAPNLLATTLDWDCYNSMFEDCTSLTKAPSTLPTEDLTDYDYCYCEMFNGCTSLVNAPVLPATTLADSCYAFMFNGCKALKKAPELPATTLVDDCYNSMFKGCSSLIDLPELKATELVSGCYYEMFSGCTAVLFQYGSYVYENIIFKCPPIPEEVYANPVENMFYPNCATPTPLVGETYGYIVM